MKKIINNFLLFFGYVISKTDLLNNFKGLTFREFNEWEVISLLPGFMGADAFKLFKILAEISQKNNAPLLEIGVFCGKSLLALSYAFPDNKIVGVDPFFDWTDTSEPEDAGHAVLYHSKARQQTREQRIKSFNQISFINGKDKNIQLDIVTQEKFLAYDVERKFQLVHLDGEHNYKAIRDFFNQADKILEQNSLIIIDDFFNPAYPGIVEALYTDSNWLTNIFPLFYGFNKAVFLYRPYTKGSVTDLIQQISARIDSRIYHTNINQHDGSLVVSKI